MEMHMRTLPWLMLACILMTGCATRSGVSEDLQGNAVTYTHDASGHFVSVEVGSSFDYKGVSERSYEGVEVEGHLFRRDDSDTILVLAMDRDAFEELAGTELDAPLTGVTAYPPRTILEPAFCQLVRAYVTTLDAEVVAVVSVRTLNPGKRPCEQWRNLEEYERSYPETVLRFNAESDRVIARLWR